MDEVYLDITYYSNSLYLLANKKYIYDLYLYSVSFIYNKQFKFNYFGAFKLGSAVSHVQSMQYFFVHRYYIYK